MKDYLDLDSDLDLDDKDLEKILYGEYKSVDEQTPTPPFIQDTIPEYESSVKVTSKDYSIF